MVTAAGVQFRVLGPLEIEAGGGLLELGGPRLRALLALLVIHAGRVVSLRALVDGLWGQHRPPDADRTANRAKSSSAYQPSRRVRSITSAWAARR